MCYSALIEKDLENINNYLAEHGLGCVALGDILAKFDDDGRVFPDSEVPVLLSEGENLCFSPMRFRLIPHWSKTNKLKFDTWNAKSETVFEKASFKTAVKKNQRGVLLATAFFERYRKDRGKEVEAFMQPTGGIFPMACIYDEWEKTRGFAILTTSPGPSQEDWMTRMPLVLKEDQLSDWLDPQHSSKELLASLEPNNTNIKCYLRGDR
jgi:putative SOS response-associated peptidase YedK